MKKINKIIFYILLYTWNLFGAVIGLFIYILKKKQVIYKENFFVSKCIILNNNKIFNFGRYIFIPDNLGYEHTYELMKIELNKVYLNNILGPFAIFIKIIALIYKKFKGE